MFLAVPTDFILAHYYRIIYACPPSTMRGDELSTTGTVVRPATAQTIVTGV
jgi:hypothetical protein